MNKSSQEYNTPLYVIITTILIFFNGLMLIFTKEILKSVKYGLLLWYNNVLPALFPFMVFTSMLIYTGFPKRLGKVIAPFCKRLFKVSGEGGFAVVTGFISGCPLGAKTVCDLYMEGLISKGEAQRLVMFCNNTGPLFVVGTVGVGMLGDRGVGIKLLIVQYISALIMGTVTGFFSEVTALGAETSREKLPDLASAFSVSVSSAVNSITLVGGFIVFFAVIAACLESCGLLGAAEKTVKGSSAFVYGILEITGGISRIKNNLPLTALLIAWGGLSIHAQSAAFISGAGLSVKKYIMGKGIQGLIAFLVWKALYNFGIL